MNYYKANTLVNTMHFNEQNLPGDCGSAHMSHPNQDVLFPFPAKQNHYFNFLKILVKYNAINTIQLPFLVCNSVALHRFLFNHHHSPSPDLFHLSLLKFCLKQYPSSPPHSPSQPQFPFCLHEFDYSRSFI